MSIRFAVIIFGIAVAFAFFIMRSDNQSITNFPSGGIEVIAFGDSLVEGVGASAGKDFVSILSRELGVPILNLGKSGDTSGSALARFETVMPEHPKLVMVLLGGNDFLRRVPRTTVFENLGTIIGKIQARGAIVVLLGVQGGVLGDSYEQEYERLAETYKTAYVSNVLEGIIGHSDLMSDPIHPNDAGYARIAERAYPVVLPLVQ